MGCASGRLGDTWAEPVCLRARIGRCLGVRVERRLVLVAARLLVVDPEEADRLAFALVVVDLAVEDLFVVVVDLQLEEAVGRMESAAAAAARTG